MTIHDIKFWASRVFPEDGWRWGALPDRSSLYRPVGPLTLRICKRKCWEVDLLQGGPESTQGAFSGIDLDLTCPDVEAFLGWLTAAHAKVRSVDSALLPPLLETPSPLGRGVIRHPKNQPPLELVQNLDVLSWHTFSLTGKAQGSAVLTGLAGKASEMALRFAVDFLAAGRKVTLLTRGVQQVRNVMNLRWGFQDAPGFYISEPWPVGDSYSLFERCKAWAQDLIVVDLPFAEGVISDHPRRLAEATGSLVLWVLSNRTDWNTRRAENTSDAVFSALNTDQPLLEVKKWCRPRGSFRFQVMVGKRPPFQAPTVLKSKRARP